MVEVLDDLFSAFDALAERYGLEKIKTIGDAYMVVAGVPEPRADHAEVMPRWRSPCTPRSRTRSRPLDGQPLQMRTGIATGRWWPGSSAAASSATTCGATP